MTTPPVSARMRADLTMLLEELERAASADDDGDPGVARRVIRGLIGRLPGYYPRGDPREGLASRLTGLLRADSQADDHTSPATRPTRADYEETITRLVADLCFDAQSPNGDRRSNRHRGREAAREILALLRPDLEMSAPPPAQRQAARG